MKAWDNMPFDGMRMFWGGFKPFASTFEPAKADA